MKKGKPWLPEELAQLRYLRETMRYTWAYISKQVGHTQASCEITYHVRVKGGRGKIPKKPGPVLGHIVEPSSRPRQHLFDEQARRLAAYARRDLTATICGDPPPGYSAHDRQRDART